MLTFLEVSHGPPERLLMKPYPLGGPVYVQGFAIPPAAGVYNTAIRNATRKRLKRGIDLPASPRRFRWRNATNANF